METLTVAVPEPLLTGVKVRVPVELTAGCVENRLLLLFETMKFTAWPDSSAGPAERFVAQLFTVFAPDPAVTVWSAPLVKDGASLTALTVIETVAGAESACPSFALKVKLSGPL